MGASHNYIMVHYPSDILGGIIAGAIGAIVAFLFINLIYKNFEKNKDNPVSKFMLNADVRNLFIK